MKRRCCKKIVDESIKKMFDEDLDKVCVVCEECKKEYLIERK